MTGPSSPETWDAFFSDFYLRAYAADEREGEAEAQALAAARLSGCPEGGELLDVPCGFGRHSVPLARAGYRVTGVDRSAALLNEARRRAGGERWPKWVAADYRELPFPDASFDAAMNLFSSLGYLGDAEDTRVLAEAARRAAGARWPKFVRADYRELPLPDESADAAVNLFSSLGYLGDDEDVHVLSEIHRVLRPGGRLVVETMHRDWLVTHFRESDWQLLGAGRLLLERRTFDPASGVAQTTQTLIDTTGDRDSRSFSVRVYTATELVAMLRRAGFAETRCYGDLDGGPFTASARLVVVARRADDGGGAPGLVA